MQRKDELLTDLAVACSPPGYLDYNPWTALLYSVTVECVLTTVRFETGVFRSDILVWEGVTNRPRYRPNLLRSAALPRMAHDGVKGIAWDKSGRKQACTRIELRAFSPSCGVCSLQRPACRRDEYGDPPRSHP